MKTGTLTISGGNGSPHDSWLLGHIMRVLRVSADGLAVCWGESSPGNSRGFVRIPRKPDFLEDTAGLQRTLSAEWKPAFNSDLSQAVFDVDILSWIGWFISRCEETNPSHFDDHGRFPRSQALAEKLGLRHLPIADLLVERIGDALMAVGRATGTRVVRTSPWPDGKKMAVCLTHDVDTAVRRSFRWAGRKLLAAGMSTARGQLHRTCRRLKEAVGLAVGGRHSPYWIFDRMAALEDARGFRSAFYLLPHFAEIAAGCRYRSWRYDIRRPDVAGVFRNLADRGWELGLHSGYTACETDDEVVRERDSLRQVFKNDEIIGGRSHFLRFRIPQSWRQYEQAGMKYDATLGWAQGWGFRSGTCWPFRPFDNENRREINLWEINLHVMDAASSSLDEMVSSTRLALNQVASVGGCACLLFHPYPWRDSGVTQFLAMYESVLDIIKTETDAWVATPREIIHNLESAFCDNS